LPAIAAIFLLRGIALQAATQPVSVVLNTSSVTLRGQAAYRFLAEVVNSTDQSVVWQVNGITGGNNTVGIIDGGRYSAPATVPSPNVVTVTATSVADPTKKATAAVQLLNLVPGVRVVTPSKVNVGLKFSITVVGWNFNPNAVVTLSDNTPVTITARSSTRITFTGTTNSVPGTSPQVIVTNPSPGAASSQALPLTVMPPITVGVFPKTATLRATSSLDFVPSISNYLTMGFTWSVNGVPGGNPTLGTINSNGLYTVPVIIPGPTVTISVTSVDDPTKSASAVLSLLNPQPLITSAPASLNASTSTTFNISGSGFAKNARVILGAQSINVHWNSSTSLTAATGAIQPPMSGILGLQVVNPDPGSLGSNIMSIAVPNTGTKLSYAAARRFLEQATWGPTASSVAHLQSIGIDAWLNEQFDPAKAPISTYSQPVDTTTGLDPLQAQFFAHALTGSDQLRQRIAFALAQIAVVSGFKLTSYDQMMAYQQILLNDAFGKYSDFMKDVTLSTAMGHYLDMVNNDLPSTKYSPDENYAREFMQLFTIGLKQLNPDGTTPANPVATYTQNDITGMARVLTGWTYPACSGTSQWPNLPCFQGQMVIFENHHDNTAKQVLGTTIQTGSAEGDLDQALAVIESYPSTKAGIPNMAPFISKSLIQHLVTSNPSPAYVERVATVFAQSGGSLKPVVKAILEDTEAGYGNGGAALPDNQGHLREPVLYVVSLLRSLGATLTSPASLNAFNKAMGQDLFSPPSVFNYYSPFYVLPATTLLAPEFQILSQEAAFSRANYAYFATHDKVSPNISVDLSNFITMASDTNPATQVASLTTLLNAVSETLLAAPVSSGVLNAAMPMLTSTKDPQIRTRNAIYLVAASPQYQVIH
jgi:uncharacterized protein (DUF1800 family)